MKITMNLKGKWVEELNKIDAEEKAKKKTMKEKEAREKQLKTEKKERAEFERLKAKFEEKE